MYSVSNHLYLAVETPLLGASLCASARQDALGSSEFLITGNRQAKSKLALLEDVKQEIQIYGKCKAVDLLGGI